MKQVTLEFPNKQARDAFMSWFSGSGEQEFMEVCEYHCEGEGVINNVDYSRAFPAWGYNPKKNGPPVIECKHIEE